MHRVGLAGGRRLQSPGDPRTRTHFGPDGQLAQALPNFRARPQQIELARAIAEAIADNSQLLAEAGTGTGKTFAYLVPALLSGGKVIIATGTKTLRDQLFDRDLPRVAMLSSCRWRAHCSRGAATTSATITWRAPAARALHGRDHIMHVQRGCLLPNAASLATVPIARRCREFASVAAGHVHAGQLPRAASAGTTRCFVLKARKEALLADVVVVNHHLLFADIALKDDGLASCCPPATPSSLMRHIARPTWPRCFSANRPACCS